MKSWRDKAVHDTKIAVGFVVIWTTSLSTLFLVVMRGAFRQQPWPVNNRGHVTSCTVATIPMITANKVQTMRLCNYFSASCRGGTRRPQNSNKIMRSVKITLNENIRNSIHSMMFILCRGAMNDDAHQQQKGCRVVCITCHRTMPHATETAVYIPGIFQTALFYNRIIHDRSFARL